MLNVRCFLATGILLAASVNALPQPEAAGPKVPRYVEGELLVKFKGGPKGKAAGRVKNALKHKVKRDFDAIGWQHIQLPPGLGLEEALARYQNDPDVLMVEPNYILPPIEPPPMPEPALDFGGQENSAPGAVTPNDPLFSNQWNLVKIGAPETWAITTGSTNVVVAVMDTGINYNHEDLRANMWRNPGEIPGNGIDDDGNGYVDDVYGIDPLGGDSDPMAEGGGTTAADHGTACAGIIGAVGNNGVGLAGVDWSVKLMAIRVVGTGMTTAKWIETFDYLLTLKNQGVNLRAVNMSFGRLAFPWPQSIIDTLTALTEAGVLAVCAAGNNSNNNDVIPDSPSSFDLPNIIAVAASDQNDNLASWSNYGPTNVDLAAPSGNPPSAITTTWGPEVDRYVSDFAGTSAAAPHVAGAVALLAAAYPDATAADIKEALLESVDVLPAFTNKMVSNGRLNVARAVEFLGQVTNAPPVILSPPLSQAVLEGADATLRVAVRGRPTEYQWQCNGLLLTNAPATAFLTLTNVSPSDAADYSLVVRNPSGSVTSAVAVITVVPLLITAQPTNQTVLAGCNVSFRVSADSTVPVTCQWQCNGTNLPTGTNLTLTLTNVQPEQAGSYAAVVSNRFGSTNSDVAMLIVIPLLITAQPQSQVVVTGRTVTLTVAVSSCVPVTCQWQCDGTNIPNATTLTLTLPNVQLTQSGDYLAVVSNRFASSNSEVATLAVRLPVTFAEQPRSQTVAVGETVVLSVVAEGSPPFGYRWRWNTNSYYIPVELGTPTLTIPHVALTNGGHYSVVVTNPVTPSKASTNAYLTVVFPPASQAVCAGTDVTLEAVVNGPKNGTLGAMRYQWQFEGTNLAGATSTNLVLANVQPVQAGNYTFIVTNTAGMAAGFTATLTVMVDSDGDGIPDGWELAHGIDQGVPDHANLDPDGDGLTTREEWEAGTDPQDQASCLKLEPLVVLGGADAVLIQFHAASNKTYTVQCRAVVDTGPWNRVADVTGAPTNRVVELLDSVPVSADAQRFYRLVTPRVP